MDVHPSKKIKTGHQDGDEQLSQHLSNSESHSDMSSDDERNDSQSIRQHSSFEQVMLDVNRCAGRLQHLNQAYSHCNHNNAYEPAVDLSEEVGELKSDEDNQNNDVKSSESEEMRAKDDKIEASSKSSSLSPEEEESQKALKEKLAQLIVKLLIKKPDLHYYQGFHDVCLTYMTLLGYKKALKKLDQLVDSHFKIFMQPTMNETQDFLALIPIIVGLEDKDCQLFLERSEVGTIFSLSWVITWFSHVISNENDVKKIFEFLQDKDHYQVLYLSAAIVLHKRDELLSLEPEMSTVHHYLSQIPRVDALPFDELFKKSVESSVKWPPELLHLELDNQRKQKLRLQNANVISSLAYRYIGPIMTNLMPANAKTALIVLILASAVALQYDKWMR